MTKDTSMKLIIGALVLAGVGALVYFVLAWPNWDVNVNGGDNGIENGVEDENGEALVDQNEDEDSEPVGNSMIRVSSPRSNTSVSNPLPIEGEARGTWFFEASFPVRMLDGDGNEVGIGYVEAQGDWMTEEFVPFKGTLTFDVPDTDTGVLVLERANPSGLAENASEVRVPVRFHNAERDITLYFYNPENDKDASGNVQCSRDGLVAVDRVIPVTQTPIQAAIRLLLGGELTPAEEAQGIETEFPLKGFELAGANLDKSGSLTLEFDDAQNASSGGSCRASILWYQIEATALQFAEVEEVQFIPADLFQP